MSTETRVTRHVAFEMSARPMAVRLWQFKGVKLMTHEPPYQGVVMPGNFRVSEETTGYGIPNTWGHSEEDAEARCRDFLTDERIAKLPVMMARLPVLNGLCHHDELDMEGVCKSCGQGGAPSRW